MRRFTAADVIRRPVHRRGRAEHLCGYHRPMGLFDLHCPLSGLPLRGSSQVVIVERKRGRWAMLTAPLRGIYDRSGFVDGTSPRRARLLEWASAVTGRENHWDALQALMGEGAAFGGRHLGYALVDAGAFDAVTMVDATAPWAGGEWVPEGLRQSLAVGAPELRPSNLDRSGQYTGLTGDFGCKSVIAAARRRAHGQPERLAAVDACELRWRR